MTDLAQVPWPILFYSDDFEYLPLEVNIIVALLKSKIFFYCKEI